MALTLGSHFQNIQSRLLRCQLLLRDYHWLTDSFVLDFFTESHWDKLPKSWAETLDSLTPKELGDWISNHNVPSQRVLPLSFIAFKTACSTLALSRTAIENLTPVKDHLQNLGNKHYPENLDKLRNIFRKHVKQKKQHELEKMGSCCALVAESVGCQTVVDVGAGIGHLSRYLSFAYRLNLICVECEGTLATSATKLDTQLLEAHAKLGFNEIKVPKHITQTIHPSTNLSRLLSEHLNTDQNSIGLIGLHTCGDLGPTMIRNFALNDSVKFIVAVGCCYFKMNIAENEPIPGFPMSSFTKVYLKPSYINYESLEVACHALDSYVDRLVESDYEKLKVHCYRATLETLLVKHSIKRAGLKSVKNAHLLPFEDYARRAVDKLNIDIGEVKSDEIEKCLDQWKRVVSFYTLRLLLAPIIETIVQLDRLLFLHEKGFDGCLVPLFDSRTSPRNFALLCTKK